MSVGGKHRGNSENMPIQGTELAVKIRTTFVLCVIQLLSCCTVFVQSSSADGVYPVVQVVAIYVLCEIS